MRRVALVIGVLVSACVSEGTEAAEAVAPSEAPASEPEPESRPAPPAGTDEPAAAGEVALDDAHARGDTGLRPAAPQTAGEDAVFYAQATAAAEAGDADGMRRAALVLLRDHPTSELVPFTYALFGDHMFDAGRWEDARQFYEKTAMHRGGDIESYARFRLAWCHAKLGDDAEALQHFVSAARIGVETTTEHGRQLAHASLRDSVGPFSRVGRIERAPEFYRHAARDARIEVADLLGRVAQAAIDEGRRGDLEKACSAAGTPSWCADALKRE